MKESIFHGAHGSQHFLYGICPIALFGLFFFPGVLFQMFLQSFFAAYLCAAVDLSSTLMHTQLLPDQWIFIQTHLCANSRSGLCSVCALTVPTAPAVQQIKNLKQFFTYSLKEECQQIHSRFHPLCIVTTLLICHSGEIQNGNKVHASRKKSFTKYKLYKIVVFACYIYFKTFSNHQPKT